MMMQRRRKTEFVPVASNTDPAVNSDTAPHRLSLSEYFKFFLYCVLLIVPAYAIVKSAIKHDWLMMIIDALLVPVGFIHGILLMFGIVA